MSELVHVALTALTVAAAAGWLAHHFTRRAASSSGPACASCPAGRTPARDRRAPAGPRSIRLPVIG